MKSISLMIAAVFAVSVAFAQAPSTQQGTKSTPTTTTNGQKVSDAAHQTATAPAAGETTNNAGTNTHKPASTSNNGNASTTGKHTGKGKHKGGKKHHTGAKPADAASN
jgi:hypothetical protein